MPNQSINILAIDTSYSACSAAIYANGKIFSEFTLTAKQHNELILPMIDSLLKQAELTLADIDVLGLANGPGSFTGVRIATAVVQAISYAHSIPVVTVSSLQVIAQGIYQQTKENQILLAVDARANSIYYGCYQAHLVLPPHEKREGLFHLLPPSKREGLFHPLPLSQGEGLFHSLPLSKGEGQGEGMMIPIQPDQQISPEAFSYPEGTWLAVGDAWQAYSLDIPDHVKLSTQAWQPEAKNMLMIVKEQYLLGKSVSAESVYPVYFTDSHWRKLPHRT